jgi:hypothetical protein
MMFRILKEGVGQNPIFWAESATVRPSFEAKPARSFPLSFSHCVHNVHIRLRSTFSPPWSHSMSYPPMLLQE